MNLSDPIFIVCLVVLAILFVAGLISACISGLKWLTIRHHLRQEAVLLELTPPPSPHNTLKATEEFFTVLRQIISMRSWRELVMGRQLSIAVEVVSSPERGIRYLVRLPKYDKPIFLHNLAAFAPTVTAEETVEYWEGEDNGDVPSRILRLRQSGPKQYALKHNQSEGSEDPIAYITNAISQLEQGELVVLQLVLLPAKWRPVQTYIEKTSSDTTVPADIITATEHKRRQAWFQTNIRVLVQAAYEERLEQRVKGLRSALSTYSYEGYQSLRSRLELPGIFRRYHYYAFRHRIPGLFSRTACLLASSELAALYHFPYGNAVYTEDLQVTRHTQLPMPLDIKNQSKADVLLGENNYRGRTTPISLTASERQRHIYVVGGTGNGKTTLLQHAFVQDMRAGKGVAVIDPHGDLAETLLAYVPEDRIDDVVYFNPADLRHPIGLNLLELPTGLDEDELLHEKDLVAESIVSMFRKIFSTNDTSGHRIEYVLRNAVHTALTLEQPTLFTVYNLLNDKDFRKKVITELENPELKLFWKEFSRAGSYQQVSMAAGITAKIGRFLFSASARRILEQPESTFNFEELIQDGKILICNVSKGQLGEDTSELFGIMVLAKLQLAALRRARMKESERQPFYVYIDEFQNFATMSFVQLLSEARKYGLFLTMAEQSTSQQSDRRMIDIVFANVGTIVAFRTSSQQDEQLLQPLFSPYVAAGSLSRLPAFQFYVRIAALQSQPPFSGQTVVLEASESELWADTVKQASRLKFGRRHLSQTVDLTPEPVVIPALTLSMKAIENGE